MITTHASFAYTCDLCDGQVPERDSTYSLTIGGVLVDICPVCQMKTIHDLITYTESVIEKRKAAQAEPSETTVITALHKLAETSRNRAGV